MAWIEYAMAWIEPTQFGGGLGQVPFLPGFLSCVTKTLAGTPRIFWPGGPSSWLVPVLMSPGVGPKELGRHLSVESAPAAPIMPRENTVTPISLLIASSTDNLPSIAQESELQSSANSVWRMRRFSPLRRNPRIARPG